MPPGSDAQAAGVVLTPRWIIAARLLHAIADSTSSYLAFAIDGNGACRVLECNGDVHALVPDGEGRYDLAPLGWTAP